MAYQKLQAGRAATVTPSDTVEILYPGGGDGKNSGCVLYVGVAGDLKVTTGGGDDVVFVAVQAGFFPVNVVKVWVTGTTATNVIALW
tara:strand:- start:704 stop:964 length:261 start_codon:yes stop_codon:yes gene_type:complete